jgi:hypothetical protein
MWIESLLLERVVDSIDWIRNIATVTSDRGIFTLFERKKTDSLLWSTRRYYVS